MSRRRRRTVEAALEAYRPLPSARGRLSWQPYEGDGRCDHQGCGQSAAHAFVRLDATQSYATGILKLACASHR